MSRVFPIGKNDVPLLVTVNNAGPVGGLTVTAKIFRPDTGDRFDFNDNTFKVTPATPSLTLIEQTPNFPGVYTSIWDASVLTVETDTVVVYESTVGTLFISDDQVSFQTVSGAADTVHDNIEAAFDRTNKTLTILAFLQGSTGTVLTATALDFTVKDELGQTVLAKVLTSTNGIFRGVFPNVSLPPNRILLTEMTFTVGSNTFDAAKPLTVIGVRNGTD